MSKPGQAASHPPRKTKAAPTEAKPERIAKVIARSGLCSRRAAEALITQGRVTLNGKKQTTPAITVSPGDQIKVDGKPLGQPEPPRLWRYHKPKGLITTTSDPQGRPTIFERLPTDLPRVMSIGRLDVATEGLLLLTNDGELARYLELPATGWLRRYRVRAHGQVTQDALDRLAGGVSVDGVRYGEIEAKLEREQGSNVWLTMALREGRNREVKRVLGHLNLEVARLIRVSYGPFTLEGLDRGVVREIPRKALREQLPAPFKQALVSEERQRAHRRR